MRNVNSKICSNLSIIVSNNEQKGSNFDMPKKNKYPLSNNSLKDFPNIKDLPSNHYGLNQVMTTDDKNRLWR